MTPTYRVLKAHIKPGCSLKERFPELSQQEPPVRGHGPNCIQPRLYQTADGRWHVEPVICRCAMRQNNNRDYWQLAETRGKPTPFVPLHRPGVLDEQTELF
jgi:hypothetical protein